MNYQFLKLKASNTEIVESQMRRLSVSTLSPFYALHSRYGKALTKIFLNFADVNFVICFFGNVRVNTTIDDQETKYDRELKI